MLKNISLNRNVLKTIAIISMVIDHFGKAFLIDVFMRQISRFFGLIAAPIFFFFLVEGYHKTKNINKYTLRLAVFALISHVPFMEYMKIIDVNDWLNLNVMYTLLICLLALRVKNEIKHPIKYLLIFVLFILSIPGDWGYTAFLIVILLEINYGNKKNQLISLAGVVFLAPTYGTYEVIMPFIQFTVDKLLIFEIWQYNWHLLGAFIPILLLTFYNNRNGLKNKILQYTFYWFYPVHLIIIILIKNFIIK